jgi:hypothetical protein
MLYTVCSDNGFAFGRQSPNFVADKFLQMGFAPGEEFPADPSEFVRSVLRHFQRERPDVFFAHNFDFDSRAHGFPFVTGKPDTRWRPGSRWMVDLVRGFGFSIPVGGRHGWINNLPGVRLSWPTDPLR